MSEVQETTPKTYEEEMIETINKARKFKIKLEDGSERDAELRYATNEEIRKAEAYANHITMEAAKGETDSNTGLTTKRPLRANMMEDAKEQGIWTNSDDIKYETLTAQLQTKLKQIIQGGIPLEEARIKALQIIEHRKEIYPLNQLRIEIFNRTAEARGDIAGHNYICVVTAVWADNEEQIFPNIAAFEKSNLIRNQVLARYNLIMRMQDQAVAMLNPEEGFLRDYGYLDNEGNVYDADKTTILMNIWKGAQEDETTAENTFAGFTDADGKVVERGEDGKALWHQSLKDEPTIEQTSEISQEPFEFDNKKKKK